MGASVYALDGSTIVPKYGMGPKHDSENEAVPSAGTRAAPQQPESVPKSQIPELGAGI